MSKIQAAEQLRRALQMFAMTLNDEEAMEIATIYPAWESGRKYKSEDIRSYGVNDVGDPQLYRCVQGHMSQADWTPDATPALWVAIGLAPDGIPVWSKPTGAHDAYNTGNSVHFPGKSDPVYTSLMDGNVYSPEEYPAGWKLEA